MFTSNEISVKEQLVGKRILITGTTGFLGKVVFEKIIREIPDVEKIILLVRGNDRYPTARERFDHEIAVSTIFDRLKDESPAHFRQFCLDKIECVTGELTENNFGLSREDFTLLAGRIDVIVHVAGCVEFREQLQRALMINTLSLLNIADLIKTAGNIPLVHVATCYVNGFNTGDCREEIVVPTSKAFKRNPKGFYEVRPLIAKLQKKIRDVEENCPLPDQLAERLVDLGVKESHRYGWNDTYTFTKWLGEQILLEALQNSTLTIVRPAIIESTYQEPVPGWVEGVKVADAIILAYAREKTPFFPARTDGVIDIIPADLVANSLILAAAETLAMPGKHRIYQCSTGSVNPLTIGRMKHLLQSETNRNAGAYDRLYPKGTPKRDFRIIDRRLFVMAMSTLKFVVTMYDGICKFTGMRNRIRKMTNFVNTTMKLAVTFSFYASPRYIFHNNKLMDLSSRISSADRSAFPVDAEIIEWERYMGPIHLSGLNRYALKDRKTAQSQAEENIRVPNVAEIPVVGGSLEHETV
ncbi:MAG: fatty acyl-CoA reductase [Smithellaceae bacterium]